MSVRMKILALGQLGLSPFTDGDLILEYCILCFHCLVCKIGPVEPLPSGCDDRIIHLRKNMGQSAWPKNNCLEGASQLCHAGHLL